MRAAFVVVALLPLIAQAAGGNDSAIRVVTYDARRVIDVEVARGVATLIVLPEGESIRWLAAGRSSDCAKAEDAWCVTNPENSNLVFAKARSRATHANNIEVVTASRAYSFRLAVAGDETRGVAQRVIVRTEPSATDTSAMLAPARREAPSPTPATDRGAPVRLRAVKPVDSVHEGQTRLTERLGSAPEVLNTDYGIAIGERSDDIVPSAVFDDGRFTYLRFPGNREIPAVFHVTADEEETVVNTRMEDDLLVVDRVSRKLRLRSGNQVVAIFNDAFDLEGQAPAQGMTISGVERAVRAPLHGAIK